MIAHIRVSGCGLLCSLYCLVVCISVPAYPTSFCSVQYIALREWFLGGLCSVFSALERQLGAPTARASMFKCSKDTTKGTGTV